jgi:glycine C-acetyltransferase
MVDDSHAVGFIGKTGRGTPEYCDVIGRVDILTGTFGKALGGASGGYAAASKTVVDLLRQRSRPYLFSNTLAPAIAASTLEALDMLMESTKLRDKLEENTKYFRTGMKQFGFDIPESPHPIAPIMLYDAEKAQRMAASMLEKGVYVIGFFYPVVPKGQARIRVQVSAAHSTEDLDFAIKAFGECRE